MSFLMKKSRKPSVKISNNKELSDKLLASDGTNAQKRPTVIKRGYTAPAQMAHQEQQVQSGQVSSPMVTNPASSPQGFMAGGVFSPGAGAGGGSHGGFEQEMAPVLSKTAQLRLKPRPKVREGYKWDFCLVLTNPDFDDGSGEPKPEPHPEHVPPQEIIERLKLAGLQTYCFYSGDGDEIFIKVRASLDRLEHRAEKIGFRMLLDDNYIESYIDDDENRIEEDFDITSYRRYELIYAKYQMSDPSRGPMFAHATNLEHPFSSTIRIKLIMSIIQGDDDDCCSLNLRKLVKDGSDSLLKYFPIHDDSLRDDLERNWLAWRVHPWQQPIDDIKDYFGEKTAMYFEFVGHYTTWLVPLAIVGVLVAIEVIIETTVDGGTLTIGLVSGWAVPFYAIFVSFWSQIMIEHWKRKEKTRSMEWGTTEFEEEEQERPEFFGEPMRSLTNGSAIKYYPPAERSKKIVQSYIFVVCSMLLVIGLVSAVFYMQFYINAYVRNSTDQSAGNTSVSIISAVQITILNLYYSEYAIKFTEAENHRTDTEFDDSLIGKLFVFNFVNSYASLFFIAFIKTNIGAGACLGPCMVQLAYQLTVIFGTQITVSKIATFLTLVVGRKYNEYKEMQEYEEMRRQGKKVIDPSEVEKESFLEEYDPSLGTLGDYSQIFVQYGYVTLFVTACPFAPLLAYASNWIEMRSDAWKLLRMNRRCVPVGAEDIGTWMTILQLTSYAAVISNAALLAFTMQFFSFSQFGLAWMFIGFQYFIFSFMAVFAEVVDDIPEEVAIQLERQTHLNELLNMTEEERQAEKEKAEHWAEMHAALSRDGAGHPEIFDRDDSELK